jgi:hypothetical protein
MLTAANVSSYPNLYINLSQIITYQSYTVDNVNYIYITLSDNTSWTFSGSDADNFTKLLKDNSILPS